MNKAFEKILERLEEVKNFEYLNGVKRFNKKERNAFDNAKQIAQEVAEEYNGGWIPVSSGNLPSDYEIHEVTAKFCNGRLYNEFAYFDESKEEWWKYDGSGIVSVIAWKEHTELYLPDEE